MSSIDDALTIKNSKFAKRHTNYIDWFMKSKMAPDLLINKMFPDCKEITESWAMMMAARRICNENGIKLSDPNVSCIVVGDGTRARTGAVMAFSTNWNVVSVDPEMNLAQLLTSDKKPFKRLQRVKDRIENVSFDLDHVFIIHPHSHAKLSNSLKSINGRRHLISMQCCVKDDIKDPTFECKDEYVHSPHNLVRCWVDV